MIIYLNWCPKKTKCLTEAVFQITSPAKVEKISLVHIDDKFWLIDSHLRTVVDTRIVYLSWEYELSSSTEKWTNSTDTTAHHARNPLDSTCNSSYSVHGATDYMTYCTSDTLTNWWARLDCSTRSASSHPLCSLLPRNIYLSCRTWCLLSGTHFCKSWWSLVSTFIVPTDWRSNGTSNGSTWSATSGSINSTKWRSEDSS